MCCNLGTESCNQRGVELVRAYFCYTNYYIQQARIKIGYGGGGVENRKVEIFFIYVMGYYLFIYFQQFIWVRKEKESEDRVRREI